MNSFTKIFRQIAFEIMNDTFEKELNPSLPNREEVDRLFKKAFPTDVEEDMVKMSAINSMQYTMGMFLLQIRADVIPGYDAEELTMFLRTMGHILLDDLEQDSQ